MKGQRKLRVHRTRKKKQGPWKENFGYSLLKFFVDFGTGMSYRRVRTEGRENIPDTSKNAVIISPNHCNTLLDALVVLRSRQGKTVFGARADLFNTKAVAAIMRFLRIVPMVRRRDGLREVLRNYDTMDEINDVLANGVAYCMFPEGTHRPMHSLLPINKGIFRMSLSANDYMDGRKDVIVVPCGLEYGDYFHYRSWLRIRYGKGINVSQFLRDNPELSEPEVYNTLRLKLKDSMAALITYFPDDGGYEASWQEFQGKFKALTGRTYRDAGLPQGKAARALLAAVTFPFFLLSAFLTLPMWCIGELLCHAKIRDKAVRNTARLAVKLVGLLIMGIVWAVVFFTKLPWWGAIIALVYSFFSYAIFYDWLNLVRK